MFFSDLDLQNWIILIIIITLISWLSLKLAGCKCSKTFKMDTYRSWAKKHF